MSNIGEQPQPRSWIITLERQDGTMAQKNVHAQGETLSEASESAESGAGEIWMAVAGRVLR
jgi:hypothetical protein